MVGYVNAVPAFVYFDSPRGKQFLWILKFTSCDFIAFISSLVEVNFCFLAVLIKDKFT